jgi:DnaJ like chaperone protein
MVRRATGGGRAMNILGKVVGALIGLFVLHGPWGAIIGMAIGHLWDAGLMKAPRPGAPSSTSFIAPLFGLAGAISKSDGRVSEAEISATENLMARMQLTAAQREEAISHFNQGKQPDFRTTAVIADLKAWANGRRDLAFLLLDMLLDIVYAEGAPLQTEKLRIVRKLCWSLNVNEQELSALAAMKGYGFAYQRGYTYGNRYGAGGGQYYEQATRTDPVAKDPYAILGLTSDASEREIKRAYRKLISQHHPDKLGDVPEELKRRAEERAREINTAYEKIQSLRGFK